MSEWQPDTITLTLTLPEGGFPYSELVEAVKAAASAEYRRGNPAGAQTLHALATLADYGACALETSKLTPFIPAPPTADGKEVISDAVRSRSDLNATPRPAHAPVGAEVAAQCLAGWIGHAWSGLREGRASDRGYAQWAYNGLKERVFQGGRQDLVDLAEQIVKLAPPQVTDEMVERMYQHLKRVRLPMTLEECRAALTAALNLTKETP